MAKVKQAKRDKGYAIRRRQSFAARHERHTVPVGACPLCSPGMRMENYGDREADEEADPLRRTEMHQ